VEPASSRSRFEDGEKTRERWPYVGQPRRFPVTGRASKLRRGRPSSLYAGLILMTVARIFFEYMALVGALTAPPVVEIPDVGEDG